MSSISFGGLASGIDTDAIIKAMMEAERQPLTRLEQTKEFEQAKLEAFETYHGKLGALNSSIDGLYLSSQVRESKVSLSDEKYISAETTSASPGTYSVAVEQLAQVQKSVSVKAYESRSAPDFGTGEIVFTVGDKQHIVEIPEAEASLYDIMGTINRSSHQHGISASIIDTGEDSENGRYHLMLTGADSATRFTMESRLHGGTEELAAGVEPLQKAQSAIVHIDGIKITSRTNAISGALNGVTLNLEGVSASDDANNLIPTTMTISADNDSVVEKIDAFVEAYNDIVSYINGTGQADEPEDGAGMLKGDNLVNSVTRRLQSMMSNRVSNTGTYDALSQLGLTTKRDGTIHFNRQAMETAVKDDFEQVAELLAGDKGVFKDYRSYLNNMTSSRDGIFATRKQTTDSMMKRIDKDIERMESRMDRREEFLLKRFTAMEQMVNMFNAQSEFLTNQMDRMPVIGRKK